MKSAYKLLFLILSLSLSVSVNHALAAESQNEQSADQVFEQGRQAFQAKDYELARKTLKPLAKAGHAKAQLYMGFIYDKGLGIERDIGRALYWLELSAEQGSIKLQYDLGSRYMYDKEVRRDYDKVVYWWQKAADAGSPLAEYNLALMYMQGSGVAVDHDKATALLKRAADQNLREAQYALGLVYTLNQGGISLDYAEAYRLFKLSAEQGYPSAQYNLAALTESGEGTTADINEAIVWYRKAAERGHELAQERLVDLERQLGDLDEKTSPVITVDKPTEVTNAPELDVIHDQAWIKKQPSIHYTIQINASHNEESLIRWLKSQQPLAPLAYYPRQQNGKVIYKAIYGSFVDQKAAQKALSEMPDGLRKLKPWARRFSTVQGQIFDN